MPKYVPFETFVARSKKAHPNKYEYRRSPSPNKIDVKCPTHGWFLQITQNHINGSGCPKCAGKGVDWISRFTSVHGATYDYSHVNYSGYKTPVEIHCAIHGQFYQTPDNHFRGKQGCPKCGNERIRNSKQLKIAEFIDRAAVVHEGVYTYGSTQFTNMLSGKVEVFCTIHDKSFTQSPVNHLAGKTGCTQCNNMTSKQEDALHAFCSIFTTAEQRNRSIIGPKEIDIYLPEHKLAIEYCGMYWHSHTDRDDERKNKRRHFEKHELCRKAGIRLITIFEADYLDHEAQIKRILRNAMGKSRGKLMARKCDVGKVGAGEARAFYNKYHPQGGTGNGEHYGLWWKEKLVACMRFTLGSNDRGVGAKERVWTLSRYATRVTVSGAASRLFKAFVREYAPEKIKSFSDNRYFSGAMYEQLGFDLESEVGPDYQVWSQKIGLRPKSHYQRRMLQTRLNDHGLDETFDANSDERAESELTYMMGAGRIFDCGKKRWLWVQLIDK